MTLPLMRRILTDAWRGTVGWAIGLIAVLLVYLPLFPSIGGSDGLIGAKMDLLPAEIVTVMGFTDFASGPGYVQATVFGLIGFVLLTIAAVSWGAAATAGFEESGAMELTLAHGTTRTQVVLEGFGALAVRLLLLGLVVFLGILALNLPAELNVDPGRLAVATAALVGLSLLTGLATMAAGALTGRRMWAVGAGVGIAVLGYAANGLGNLSPSLDWLREASPYFWAFGGAPLSSGADASGLALLYGACAVLLALAVVGLRRRDVGI